MIETHNDPDNAWSDSKQQITPKNLKELTKNLKVRRITNNDEVLYYCWINRFCVKKIIVFVDDFRWNDT